MSIQDASEALNLELPPRPRYAPRKPDSVGRVIAPLPNLKPVNPATEPDPMDNPQDRAVFHLSPPPVYRTANPRPLDVVFVGSGFSGMTFGIMSQWRLKSVGTQAVGAMFSPTPTSSVSKLSIGVNPMLNGMKSHVFARYNLAQLVSFNHAVVAADYEEERAKWRVTIEKSDPSTGKKERFEKICDILVNGTGVLNSVAGKTVGVIGNGSTAIQVVQTIVPQVAHLDHYVRTPTYMQAYLEGGIKMSDEKRQKFRDPAYAREFIRKTYQDREKYWVMFTGGEHKLNKVVVKVVLEGAAGFVPIAWFSDACLNPQRSLEYLERSVKDPELRAKLTPNFAYGCRRPIFTDTYYPAIQRPNVSLRREPIKRFYERGLVLDLGDGKEEFRELEVVVCATGFAANWVSKYMPVRGRGGELLADTWKENPEAYRTLTVHGFPNYAYLNLDSIECEPALLTMKVKLEAQRAFAKDAQDWLKTNSVWNTDCGGWYRFAEVQETQGVFLPFWIGQAEIEAQVLGGELGYDSTESRFNPRTRRWETDRVTHWRPIDIPIQWKRTYSATDPAHTFLRRYASSTRPRSLAERIVDPESLGSTVLFKAEMTDDPDEPGGTRRVEAFTVRPDRAAGEMRAAVEARERYEADVDLRRTVLCPFPSDVNRPTLATWSLVSDARLFNADHTRFLRLRVQVRRFNLSPIYFPVYTLHVAYLGRSFPTIISAFSGKASGARFYAVERVGGAVLTLGVIVGAWAGWTAATVAWRAMIGAVMAGWAARFIPRLVLFFQSMLHRAERQSEQIWNETHRGAQWDWSAEDEGSRTTGGDGSERSRQRGGRAEARSGNVADPLGFYKTLGVSTKATKEELQSAFRGLAMKHHPDRYSTAKEKQAATKRFQAVSEAYGVLRDSVKRREYDLYGTAR
ncbi:hypothetical protein HDU93_000556 [Gonapodya sp. JEL0774]|nr:hypothetical protein HDU93_000556 [Gonapodya sp. JEL0774]